MANVYVRSGATGTGTGADWTNAYTKLSTAVAAKAAGDIFCVSEDHAETQAAGMQIAFPGTAANPNFVYCVNHAGTVPPVSADLRTTATITTTGGSYLDLSSGYVYIYGVTFSCGTGATSQLLTICDGSAGWMRFDSCALQKLGTGATGSAISFGRVGGSNNRLKIDLNNTTLQFGATGDGISVNSCDFKWRNTASAVTGATLPTTLFAISQNVANMQLEAVDLSALGSGKTIVGALASANKVFLKDCTLGASVTIAATPTDQGGAETYVIRSDSSGTNYRHEKYQYMGTQVAETAIIRTGGASDGATGLSWKLTTTANSKWVLPFEALPIAIWNATTAANVTAIIEGVWNAAALPNNDDFWFDLEYLGDASSPQGSFKSGTKADNLAFGAALTASTQAWDSLVTARANSTAYSVGEVRKVASNSGRIFFCTTAGTSSSSEPGGYASAVDGGSVTDGTAVFRAAVRFKLAVTASSPQPAQAGTMYLYPKAAKASSTFWIDPLATLS